MAYVCAYCSEEHENWPPDLAFQRPDVVWCIFGQDREARVKENDDVCVLDDRRHFLRAFMPIPIHDTDEVWGLGLWVEVSKQDFDAYCDHYNEDGHDKPGFGGVVANDLPMYPDAMGMRVEVRLGSASERPRLWIIDGDGPLARAQTDGVSQAELHRMLMD